VKIEPFALERFFARHEFSARYLLSSSDCEPFSMQALLEMADEETRRLWSGLHLGYTETPGHPALREEIAGLYQGLAPRDVLVTAPEEGIFLLMQALLQPGDHVVCTSPGYQSLYEVARSIGCEVSMWRPDESRGWRFDLAELEGLLRGDTRLVVVNFPHNPTGSLLDREAHTALPALLRSRGIPLFSDEMYRFLEHDPDRLLPSACEMDTRSVTLGGLSKSFGLPGLRIGWLATRDREALDRVSRLKDYTTICSSAPSEILALAALRSRDRILTAQRGRVRRNLRLLEEFFEAHSGCFRWNRPSGGSICFPRVEVVEDTYRFCEDLVRETGIMLAPSRMFHYGERHVRFGFGRDDLAQGLERLSDYLFRFGGS
jgi:aspartate/methionine/tyrosine aminotransferase